MVAYASARVAGDFSVNDMLTYEPASDSFAAVFVIFSHLQLQYADFEAAMRKYVAALRPGGLLVLGQMPGDDHVREDEEGRGGWGDETRTWVEDYPAPFMGEMLPTLMLSREGQRRFLRGLGLEVVWERIDLFQPKNERCVPEEQQYIIARKRGGAEVQRGALVA
jgi:SAM-dependent methyltransferase